MPAPKGHARYGGRQKGTPNKVTRDLFAKLEEKSFDPWAEMIEIARDMNHPDRTTAIKEMLQYIYPKRKAVEVSGSMDLRVQQELDALMGLSEEELKKLLVEALKK